MTAPARPRPRPRLRVLRALVLLPVACLVTGVLAAAAAFPVVGAMGLVARSGAESFEALPFELIEPPLPQASRILARDGSTLAVVYFNENRVIVPLDRVPGVMQAAILAIEDARFYEHGGVDLRGLMRAFVHNTRAGTIEEGGSTITQQYVKNVLVVSATDAESRKAAVERTTARKIREARYAVALEKRYSKAQILEKYLNIAYFGSGVYGVGTAAQHYFSKPVEDLTAGEAALLAGLVQNPGGFDPVRKPKAAKARRDLVLARMAEVGMLDPAAAAAEAKRPIRLKLDEPPGLEDNPLAPYFLDHLRTLILEDPDGSLAPIFGASASQRAQRLFQGGLTIRTTLDPALQRHANAVVRQALPDPGDPAAAVVVVQPGTGEILAMAGVNHERRTKKVNLATGGTTGFQAGSTFKPFVLAAAIEQNIPLGLTLEAPQTYRSKVFQNYRDGRIEQYQARNAGDSEAGTFDVVHATWESVNTFFIQLEERTGIERPAQIAEAMGVRAFPLARVPSLVLGSNEVSPLDMAAAFAAFAAHGRYCRPSAIVSVTRPDGSPAQAPPARCTQAIAPRVADTVTSVLRGVITSGTGRAAAIGRPAAGKTGTTNGPTAAWFDGYTPDLAAAVWVGHPSEPAKNVLRNVQGIRTVYGGTLPARIWRDVMAFAHARRPVRDFVLTDVAPYVKQVPKPKPKPSPSVSPSPGDRPPDDKKKCRGRGCDD